jgi:hypothetical protein
MLVMSTASPTMPPVATAAIMSTSIMSVATTSIMTMPATGVDIASLERQEQHYHSYSQ